MVIDCQANLLASLDSRFVVPLVRISEAPKAAQRLNPVFDIAGADFLMLTQAAAAVERRELGPIIVSLIDSSFEITGALDVLISGV